MAERFGKDLVLLDRLNSGGMAEVFRAKMLGVAGFEKTVAVKRILPHFTADEEFKTLFQMEMNLCAQFQHPNIVQVFSNGEKDGYLYLVMEFVDGKNLRQLINTAEKRKFSIPNEIYCFVVNEVIKGLHYAHTYKEEITKRPLNVIHRDMSPPNIMLSYDGTVKIVDFGIAKAAGGIELTKTGLLRGKVAYMSPEQVRGKSLDPRTDIFSVGIVLYELLTARRLFKGESYMKTARMVLGEKIAPPSELNPDVPKELDAIVMRALARRRQDRYQTAEEFSHELVLFMNKNYPNFVPTEFAHLMKKIFEPEINQEIRERQSQSIEAPTDLTPSDKLPAQVQHQPTMTPREIRANARISQHITGTHNRVGSPLVNLLFLAGAFSVAVGIVHPRLFQKIKTAVKNEIVDILSDELPKKPVAHDQSGDKTQEVGRAEGQKSGRAPSGLFSPDEAEKEDSASPNVADSTSNHPAADPDSPGSPNSPNSGDALSKILEHGSSLKDTGSSKTTPSPVASASPSGKTKGTEVPSTVASSEPEPEVKPAEPSVPAVTTPWKPPKEILHSKPTTRSAPVVLPRPRSPTNLPSGASQAASLDVVSPKAAQRFALSEGTKELSRAVEVKWYVNPLNAPVELTLNLIEDASGRKPSSSAPVLTKTFVGDSGKGETSIPIRVPGKYELMLTTQSKDGFSPAQQKREFFLDSTFRGLKLNEPIIETDSKNQTRFKLSWKSVTGVRQYQVDFYNSMNAKKPMKTAKANGASLLLEDLTGLEGQVFWEVTGFLRNGFQIVSDRTPSSYRFDLQPPILGSPNPHATVTQQEIQLEENRLLFTWRKSDRAEEYEIQIGGDAQFASMILTRKTSENFFFLKNPRPRTYWWRVRSYAQGMGSLFSPPQKVTVVNR